MAADLAAFRAQFPELTELAPIPMRPSGAPWSKRKSCIPGANSRRSTAPPTSPLWRRLRADGIAPAGEVESEGVGPISTSYVMQAESSGRGQGSRDAFFTRTEYGRHFLTLEKRGPRYTVGAVVAGY